MINEFCSRVKPSNNNAKKLFYALLCAAAVITSVYLIIPNYKGIVGLFSVCAIVGAVLVYTKYIGVEYYYEITHDTAGSPLFLVTQTIGKRSTTLCRIDLHTIVKVEKMSTEERGRHKTERGYKKYSYLPTLMPKEALLITVRSPHENAEIFIEAGDDFRSLLSAYAYEARENRFENEEY